MNPQALKRRGRILCVEDDTAIGGIMVQLLARQGYWVAHLENGLAAWNRLTGNLGDYHVIVTDNQMPQGNGLELVGRLREAGFLGRIVVYSSPLAPAAEACYRSLGVEAFVPKGAPMTKFLQAIARPPKENPSHA